MPIDQLIHSSIFLAILEILSPSSWYFAPFLNFIFQLHLLPEKIKDVKEEDLEFFFHKDEGVLDIKGNVMENPKVRYTN